MSLGQNFPVSDYYKDQILDAETISRGGGWWTAVLLIRDPKTEKPFLSLYRWQLDGDTWKMRKSIGFKSRRQIDAVVAVLSKMVSRLDEDSEA